MPQVFVVPPEEDDTPAWCCFDAHMPPSSSTSASDTGSPHHVPEILQKDDVSLFYYDLKEPQSLLDTVPSDTETTSVMDVLMKDVFMEFNIETGLDMEEMNEDPDLEANVGNDSEVVEVIKVGRHTTDVEGHFRTSKSLKARALGVFKILKNAEKDPPRFRSKAQVILPPTNEGTRAKKTKSRHSSTTSSRSFHPFMTPNASPSASSFDLTDVSSTPSLNESRYPKASPSISSFDLAEVSSIPSLNDSRYPLSLRNVSLSGVQASPLGFTSSSTVSPDFRSPLSTSSARPNRRHFSMTINRIFSFSKSVEASDVFPVSRSEKSLGPPTEPETPTEEGTSLTPEHTMLPGQKCLPTSDSPLEERNPSFEMRLGSLHFDSLSFDVDKF
ncbi:hypothetical protein C0993_005663 [Termitomyces sp. T159_Od127]|nr:hypothetical protein C0993_005663 [Termitomyces sp. T159_Od127]